MIDGKKLDPFPVYLLQEVINEGTKNFTPRYIAFGDQHGKTLAMLMMSLGSATYECFEEIFTVKKASFIETDPFIEEELELKNLVRRASREEV